jgi:hypothetical protein
MAGAAIANEIRAIAGGLAGKRLDAIQIKDLMIDTEKARGKGSKSRSKSSTKRNRDDNDRAAAENYYQAWSRSIRAKAKEIENPKPKAARKATSKPSRPSRRS